MWFTVCRWPQSQEGAWSRPRLCKLVRHGPLPVRKRFIMQRPCMTREIETWLSHSRVSNNSVVDHRSRRPVLSPLRNCVDRCHIGRRDASRGGGSRVIHLRNRNQFHYRTKSSFDKCITLLHFISRLLSLQPVLSTTAVPFPSSPPRPYLRPWIGLPLRGGVAVHHTDLELDRL